MIKTLNKAGVEEMYLNIKTRSNVISPQLTYVQW